MVHPAPSFVLASSSSALPGLAVHCPPRLTPNLAPKAGFSELPAWSRDNKDVSCFATNMRSVDTMTNKRAAEPVPPPVASEELRQCSICKEAKPSDDFIRDARRATGLDARCKMCRRKQHHTRKLQNLATGGMPTVQEKECTRCHTIKPASDFKRHAYTNSGLDSWCKACCSERRREKGRGERVEAPTVSSKECSMCHTVKPAGEFTRDAGKRTGLGTRCRVCEALYRRQQRKKHKLAAEAAAAAAAAATAGAATAATATAAIGGSATTSAVSSAAAAPALSAVSSVQQQQQQPAMGLRSPGSQRHEAYPHLPHVTAGLVLVAPSGELASHTAAAVTVTPSFAPPAAAAASVSTSSTPAQQLQQQQQQPQGASTTTGAAAAGAAGAAAAAPAAMSYRAATPSAARRWSTSAPMQQPPMQQQQQQPASVYSGTSSVTAMVQPKQQQMDLYPSSTPGLFPSSTPGLFPSSTSAFVKAEVKQEEAEGPHNPFSFGTSLPPPPPSWGATFGNGGNATFGSSVPQWGGLSAAAVAAGVAATADGLGAGPAGSSHNPSAAALMRLASPGLAGFFSRNNSTPELPAWLAPELDMGMGMGLGSMGMGLDQVPSLTGALGMGMDGLGLDQESWELPEILPLTGVTVAPAGVTAGGALLPPLTPHPSEAGDGAHGVLPGGAGGTGGTGATATSMTDLEALLGLGEAEDMVTEEGGPQQDDAVQQAVQQAVPQYRVSAGGTSHLGWVVSTGGPTHTETFSPTATTAMDAAAATAAVPQQLASLGSTTSRRVSELSASYGCTAAGVAAASGTAPMDVVMGPPPSRHSMHTHSMHSHSQAGALAATPLGSDNQLVVGRPPMAGFNDVTHVAEAVEGGMFDDVLMGGPAPEWPHHGSSHVHGMHLPW